MSDPNEQFALPKSIKLKLLFSIPASLIFFGLILFVPAGTLEWLQGWLYIALFAGFIVINMTCLLMFNPVLIERRMQMPPGTKTWDKIWAALNGPLIGSIFILAGLEVRYGETTPIEPAWWLGLLVYLAGNALLTWSMAANPFFEKTVRIQTDNKQHVIDTGPYAIVRHPGYSGFMGWILSAPMLLQSEWAWWPTIVAAFGLLVRTYLEDRTLTEELEGYAEYRTRVRARLIPYIW